MDVAHCTDSYRQGWQLVGNCQKVVALIHMLLSAAATLLRLFHRELRHGIPLNRISLTQIYRHMWQQCANPHRKWWADWQHFVFSVENSFSLDYNHIHVRYTGESHLPECVTRCQT